MGVRDEPDAHPIAGGRGGEPLPPQPLPGSLRQLPVSGSRHRAQHGGAGAVGSAARHEARREPRRGGGQPPAAAGLGGALRERRQQRRAARRRLAAAERLAGGKPAADAGAFIAAGRATGRRPRRGEAACGGQVGAAAGARRAERKRAARRQPDGSARRHRHAVQVGRHVGAANRREHAVRRVDAHADAAERQLQRRRAARIAAQQIGCLQRDRIHRAAGRHALGSQAGTAQMLQLGAEAGADDRERRFLRPHPHPFLSALMTFIVAHAGSSLPSRASTSSTGPATSCLAGSPFR